MLVDMRKELNNPDTAAPFIPFLLNISLYFSIKGMKHLLSDADCEVRPKRMISPAETSCQLYAGSKEVFPI